VNQADRAAWREDANQAMTKLWKRNKPFTSDNLLMLVAHPDEEHNECGPNNMIGAVFRKWSQQQQIEVVGYTESQQPHRKGGLIRVWRRKQ